MFWADKIAQELKKRNLLLEWVDDAKTPSGRVHVGALRGVVIHDLIFKSLKSEGVNSKYTYIIEDHDPMDGLPVYLPREKFEKYLGMPLYKIPSPDPGFKNYAEYYGLEFKKVFNTIGCNPEIIWGTELYLSGKMNPLIKESLDKVDEIRKIYKKIYKKEIARDWYPFQVYCPNCGKVSTTNVNNWDGKEASFVCEIDKVDWTKGCGFKGNISPFSPNEKGDIAGKLTYKIEWPAKWKVLGITVEWAGKDHMSKGGSFDIASLVSKNVFNYPAPNAHSYEHFLLGGKKMSSSKGIGSSAADMLEILPPEILRFLMVKTNYNQAINFDPTGETIPNLFYEYQKAADAFINKSNEDQARIFELSQVGEIKFPPKIRFSALAQWVQMPNMEEEIKKEGLEDWAKYAKIWLEKYASESDKFTIKKELPKETKNLSEKQKRYLAKVLSEINKKWNPEEFQESLYEWSKQIGITSKEAFSAIYITLIGKDHGPKAAWLILSLDKKFLKIRFAEASR